MKSTKNHQVTVTSPYRMPAIGWKCAIIVAPKSCLSLAAANQPATAFGA